MRYTLLGISFSSGSIRVVLSLLLGSAILVYGGYMFAVQTPELDSTEQVDATIISTSVDRTSGPNPAFVPNATYTFTYEGETYTASGMYSGENPREFDTKREARNRLSAIEPGEIETVFIPNNSPHAAYIRQSRGSRPIYLMGIGGIILLLGLCNGIYRFYKL